MGAQCAVGGRTRHPPLLSRWPCCPRSSLNCLLQNLKFLLDLTAFLYPKVSPVFLQGSSRTRISSLFLLTLTCWIRTYSLLTKASNALPVLEPETQVYPDSVPELYLLECEQKVQGSLGERQGQRYGLMEMLSWHLCQGSLDLFSQN